MLTAKYPPMGWNSWDCYGAAVTEDTVRKNAEYIAAHMLQHGWEYVVVDIQWYQPTAVNHNYEPFSNLTMDEYGRLLPAANRFPSSADGAGFKPLADYIHSLGLKFGIHIMRGMPRMAAHRHMPIYGSDKRCNEVANPNSICAWNPDMYGLKCENSGAADYYNSIFNLYAEWGVDFVKCDDIAREYPHAAREIELISDACRNCGRDIVLSLSPGPAPLDQAEHLKKHANMWRITDDFWDNWPLLKAMFERAEKWCVHSGPGHWPDADMLPVGALRQCIDPDSRTKFTHAEQRTLMSLWCMMRSPLMVGAELTKNDEFTLKLLTNDKLLDIQRTTHCAHPITTTSNESIWIAPRRDGNGIYAALFNLSDETRTVSLALEDIGYAVEKADEIWSGTTLCKPVCLTVALQPHDAAVYHMK